MEDGDAEGEGGSALGLPWALPGSLQGHVIRPGIVHRLDKGTTGLLVVAKDDYSLAGLAAQFKAHTVPPVSDNFPMCMCCLCICGMIPSMV